VATDAERLARFQREAEVLARLNHPNIAQIHGLEKSDGTTALVMEFVEGPTLADRIAQGPGSRTVPGCAAWHRCDTGVTSNLDLRSIPFIPGSPGQHSSMPSPKSSATPARRAFHSVTCPSWVHFTATVVARPKTASNGIPPIGAKCSTSVRTSVSAHSSRTIVTSTQREYFNRDAKNRTRFRVPSRKRTRTWPKSCCENS
jgi:Protein tyrosine and serine/threonine kinase